ncbi:MAG TPA: hypothetical protein PKY05_18960, partial [Fibrobacteria bacterium]|nr:hypothetical protein [Fibrobacteria bacterium]
EGSAMFFVSSFTVLHLVLSLAAGFGPKESALAALYVAIIATVLESISLSGTDNLWIPLGTMAVLLNLPDKSVPYLVEQNALLAGSLVVSVAVLSRHRQLGLAPRAALGLLAYSCHAFEGPVWSGAAFAALALAAWGRGASLRIPQATRMRPVFWCALPVLAWNLGTRYLHLDRALAFPAFATCLAGTLAYLWTLLCPDGRIPRPLRAGLLALAVTAIAIVTNPSPSSVVVWALVALGAWGVDVIAHGLRPRFEPATYGLRVLAAVTFATSLVVRVAMEAFSK